MRSVRPRRKTASGMRKCESVRMAEAFLENVIVVLPDCIAIEWRKHSGGVYFLSRR
jgi:hypothetical protein